MTSKITIGGGIRTLNFYPGDFSIDGKFKSDGPLAFIGGGITVNGSVTAASVLLAGSSSSVPELKSTLLGSGRLTTSNTSNLVVRTKGKVTATSGNVVMAGRSIFNSGQIRATKGDAVLKTGSQLDVGWNDVSWLAGLSSSSVNHNITNDVTGRISARNITLEARRLRGGINNSITNNGILSAADTITLITGKPGTVDGAGTYAQRTFGIENNGTIAAATVVISPYFIAGPGGVPTDRSFTVEELPQSQELQSLAVGGKVIVPQPEQTPTDNASAVIDSTRGGNLTPATSIVIPQLAASLSQMNAMQQPKVNTLSVSSTSDQLRGEGKPTANTKNKPRPKAKPVLVRGAFFGTKISATITSAQ